MKRRASWILVALAGLSLTAAAWGYALLGSTWAENRPVMQLQLGASGRLIDGASSWNEVAEGALAIWNRSIASLQFTVVRDSPAAIGDGNGLNNVFFSRTIFGFDFGDAVAITTEWTDDWDRRIEGDVLFNANLDWNSYRGNLRRSARDTLYDLRRVALHEFGHVLGLDHPDEAGQSALAIMNSRVSNIDALMADDIRGAQALYGARVGRIRAEFIAPRPNRSTVQASSYLFRGIADQTNVRRVLLVNSRTGARRFYLAGGVRVWDRRLPLRPGVNVIRLYAETLAGQRLQISQRVVVRRD